MAEEDLTLHAKLRDELSRPIRRLRSELTVLARAGRTELAKLGTMGRGAFTKLGDGMETFRRRFGGVGRTLSNVSRGLGRGLKYGALGAGVALAGVGTAAIHGAIEAENAMNQTRAVIDSTGRAAGVNAKHVEGLAQEIMSYSGISDEAVQAGENMLLTFKNIKNGVGEDEQMFDEATRTLADFSTAMGKDMKTSAIMLGKALNDPVAGMSAMGRAGVQFSDDQKAAIEAMVESGDLMGAQKTIIAELESQFGGSAKAMGETAQGQFNIMKETVGNSLEKVGASILPLATKALPMLTETFTSLLETALPAIETIVGALGDSLGPVIEALSPILADLGEIFGELIRAAAPIVTLVAEALGQALRVLMPALMPFIDALGEGLMSALEELAPVMPELAESLGEILVALTPLIPPLAELIGLFVRLLVGPGAKLVAWLVGKLAGAITGVVTTVTGLVGEWSESWNAIKEAFGNVVGPILGFFDKILGPIDELIGKILEVTGLLEVLGGADLGGLGDDLVNQYNAGQTTTGGSVDTTSAGAPKQVRALGGWTTRDRPTLVGELGPEVFVPGVTGTVLPTKALKAWLGASPGGARGGDGATYNFNGPLIGEVHATSDVDVEAAVARALRRARGSAEERYTNVDR